MNICLIGNNLTSLVLAKNLINKGIKVFIYHENIKKQENQSRTIGISKSNFNFLDKEIINIKKKLAWKINQIEIYSEKYGDEKILNFEDLNKGLFAMIKNYELYNILINDLKKNKLFKKILIQNDNFYKKILKEKKNDLIINCISDNKFSKIFFNDKINKNYKSYAYTTIIKHQNFSNRKAIQIFTKIGPMAFLPISSSETSVVFSVSNKVNILKENDIKNLIKKYNKNYKIKNFCKIEKFKLNFSLAKKYYYKNILKFGDDLHKIHPLAGQGFNMTLRDIKIFSEIVQNRKDLGLPFDSLVCKEFEKKTKHLNFTFASGIDFIHEFFDFDNKFKNNYSNELLKYISNNKSLNNFFSKYADKGLPV